MPVGAAPAAPKTPVVSWAVFIVLVLAAAVYEYRTATRLPRMVAVHFDQAGLATSFMAVSRYRIAISLFSIVLPVALVAVMTFAYSRATDVKLPNRDYWMAPHRIAGTRAFLVAHGIWFGSILVGLMCFVQWLVLDANQRRPPQLSNAAMLLGLSVLLGCMVVWIATLTVAFRRRA
jgi:uncharacterized membrane protein